MLVSSNDPCRVLQEFRTHHQYHLLERLNLHLGLATLSRASINAPRLSSWRLGLHEGFVANRLIL
jgi:hypothetical protein